MADLLKFFYKLKMIKVFNGISENFTIPNPRYPHPPEFHDIEVDHDDKNILNL